MLTDERLLELWSQTLKGNWVDAIAFARAVEAEARKMALDEAAKACESVPNDWDDKAFDCAATIRALV